MQHGMGAPAGVKGNQVQYLSGPATVTRESREQCHWATGKARAGGDLGARKPALSVTIGCLRKKGEVVSRAMILTGCVPFLILSLPMLRIYCWG